MSGPFESHEAQSPMFKRRLLVLDDRLDVVEAKTLEAGYGNKKKTLESKQVYCSAYLASSAEGSPSYAGSSALASWYCLYSKTRSSIFASASENFISSLPSPVYR